MTDLWLIEHGEAAVREQTEDVTRACEGRRRDGASSSTVRTAFNVSGCVWLWLVRVETRNLCQDVDMCVTVPAVIARSPVMGGPAAMAAPARRCALEHQQQLTAARPAHAFGLWACVTQS